MSGQERMYAVPQPYFEDVKTPAAAENLAAASRTELDRLRAKVKAAEATAAKQTDWTERVRAEQHAKSLARELQSAEFNARQATQQGSYVLSDCGSAYVFVPDAKPTRLAAQSGDSGGGGGPERMFAEPVAYFETGEAR